MFNKHSSYDQIPPDKQKGITIVVLDDEELTHKRLNVVFQLSEFKTATIIHTATIQECFDVLASTRVNVLILDKTLKNKVSSLTRIPDCLNFQPHLQILILTGSQQIEDVVQAMNLGAFGYVTKDSPDDLITHQIQKAIRVSVLKHQNDIKQNIKDYKIHIGSSVKSLKIKQQLIAVSETNRPVLLLGETGTGKTTAAKLIHQERTRYLKETDRPFIDVNLTSLSTSLIESELFGSEKGAYTGSKATKIGFFEKANSGTLFLDEIGDISLEIQKKLLTVIDTGEFYRIGGTQKFKSQFKLICATNKNLENLVVEGLFREDLYMRISTFTVLIPALSERKEDIPEIIRTLLSKLSAENNVPVSYEDLPQEFIEYLTQNPPPGNFRGLEQQISRLLVFSPKRKDGKVFLENWKNTLNMRKLRSSYHTLISNNFPGVRQYLKQVENDIYKEACKKFSSNREIAKALKVSEAAVSLHLKELRRTQKRDCYA